MNIIYFLILKFLKEEKFKTIFIILLCLIINFLKINIISYITANIIKFMNKADYDKLIEYFYYFIIISSVYTILFIFYKYYETKLLSNLRQFMRFELVKSILILNNEEYSNFNFTKLNSPILRISNNFFYILQDLISTFIPTLSFLITVFVYFIYKNLDIGLIFIIGNIILFFYISLIIKYIIYYNNKYENNVRENESSIVEILNNIDKIILKGNVNNEINDFNINSNQLKNNAFQFYSKSSYYGLFMNIIIYLTIFIIIYKMINKSINKNFSSITFISFMTIILLYRDFMTNLISNIPSVIEFIGRSKNIIKIFDSMNKNYEKILLKKYKNYNIKFNKIYFENICFTYKNNKKIFENYNLEIKTEKIIGIIGDSGSGKSTLLKLLIKLFKCDSGSIYIDDININNISPDFIRKNINYVHQNSKLFDKTVNENIFYGCNNIEKCKKHLIEIMKYDKIRILLENINLEKKAGHNGDNLSGGQKQVINIINGLINPSKIVILDEPTNALDYELKKDIINIIQYFKKYKKSIIIITHDKDIYEILDQKIEIKKLKLKN